MIVLYVLQLIVLALLLMRAWRDACWVIRSSVAIGAALGIRPARRSGMLSAALADSDRTPRFAVRSLNLLRETRGADVGEPPILIVRDVLYRRAYVMRGLARMASVTTLLSIVIELSWGLGGGSGIEGLQAGLPQRLAIGSAVTSLAIGGTTLALYAWLARRMRSRCRGLLTTLRRLDATQAETP